MYFKGNGASDSERVYFYLDGNDGLRQYGSYTKGSTYSTKVELAGNTYFGPSGTSLKNVSLGYQTNSRDVTINAGTKEETTVKEYSNYGTHEMIVSGSDNIVKINALQIGNTAMTTDNWGKFTVADSGSDISVNQLYVFKGTDTSKDNIAGGILKFDISSDSVSKINATTVSNLTGLIELDLSDFTSAEIDVDYEFARFSFCSKVAK